MKKRFFKSKTSKIAERSTDKKSFLSLGGESEGRFRQNIMSSRWKSLADHRIEQSHNSSLLQVTAHSQLRVAPQLCFRHIDSARGNGVTVTSDIARGTDLIVEQALICSITNASRRNGEDKAGLRYCAICCCFLGSLREEIERLAAVPCNDDGGDDDDRGNSAPDAKQLDVDCCVDLLTHLATEFGFDQRHPLWFGIEASATSSSPFASKNPARCAELTELYAQFRCTRCHDRAQTKLLPQSLEECKALLLLLMVSVPSSPTSSSLAAPILQLESLAATFDEAIYSVFRCVCYLLDETLADFDFDPPSFASCSAPAKGRSGISQSTIDTIIASFHQRLEKFCGCFDEGVCRSPDARELNLFRLVAQSASCALQNVVCVLFWFPPLDDVSGASFSSAPLLSVQQLFLLRCCLQNNQHRSIVPSPVVALMAACKKQRHESLLCRDEDDTLKFLRRLLCRGNSDDRSSIHACALFNTTSRLNHSCRPSANVEPSLECRGCTIRVVASRDIAAGEEVRISYVEQTHDIVGGDADDATDQTSGDDPVAKRHAMLKRNYGFHCDCQSLL